MWQQMERVEEEIAGSNLLIKDPQLTAYLGDLIGRVGGPAARDMRIYLARIPEFNADHVPDRLHGRSSPGCCCGCATRRSWPASSRTKAAHFLRKHQIRQWRDMRRKTDIFSILAMGAGVAGGAAGVYAGDLVQLAQLGTILSLLQIQPRRWRPRPMRWASGCSPRPAIDPMAMSETWEQLIGELDLSRRISPQAARPRYFALFDTHPSPEARMADLKISAARGDGSRAGPMTMAATRYLAAIAPHPPDAARRPGQAERPGRQPVYHQHAGQGWLERPAALL